MPTQADTTASGEPVIEVNDVWKRFGSLEVLKGISLAVGRGETLVIIGASGCGKSVLLKHIIGLLRPDSGSVVFDRQEISTMPKMQLAQVRRRFGMVFQGAALFDSFSVKENVAFGLRRHTDYSEEKMSAVVAEKLRLVGLVGLEQKMPGELSGGMKKRVGIARAIALEPEVLLYDEPTTGLDPIMADVINELILRVQKSQNATSVVVTHDMQSAYKVATRIAMLHDGRIIEVGSPEEIQNTHNPTVSQFIRGEAGDLIDTALG
ncbi:MAG: ABC transporter ATP-binding protein [Planctomycetes bacterium]|nr:ABC transporter ATP-binding protein [Planctomycetota bacterium]